MTVTVTLQSLFKVPPPLHPRLWTSCKWQNFILSFTGVFNDFGKHHPEPLSSCLLQLRWWRHVNTWTFSQLRPEVAAKWCWIHRSNQSERVGLQSLFFFPRLNVILLEFIFLPLNFFLMMMSRSYHTCCTSISIQHAAQREKKKPWARCESRLARTNSGAVIGKLNWGEMASC